MRAQPAEGKRSLVTVSWRSLRKLSKLGGCTAGVPELLGDVLRDESAGCSVSLKAAIGADEAVMRRGSSGGWARRGPKETGPRPSHN